MFRYLGYTKSQLLDKLMYSNATICAAITFSVIPLISFWTYRYINVLCSKGRNNLGGGDELA